MCYKTRTHTYLQHLTLLAKRAHRWAMVRPISLVIGHPVNEVDRVVVHHAGDAY
ncbi:MAG: hypothetical protein OEV26_05755 [Gallionella sp.]|nr:hypothetical protein [Gallionella sp.]